MFDESKKNVWKKHTRYVCFCYIHMSPPPFFYPQDIHQNTALASKRSWLPFLTNLKSISVSGMGADSCWLSERLGAAQGLTLVWLGNAGAGRRWRSRRSRWARWAWQTLVPWESWWTSRACVEGGHNTWLWWQTHGCLMAKGEQPDQQLVRGREVCVDVINMRQVFNGLLLGTHSGAWQRSNKHH